MTRVKRLVVLWISFLLITHAQGQDMPLSDSLNTQNDSAHISKRSFPYRTVISLGMVGFGAATLRSNDLKEFNTTVINSVGKSSNKPNFHLDDFLALAPTVAVFGLQIAHVPSKHTIGQTFVINGIAEIISNIVVMGTKSFHLEWRPDSSNRSSFPSGHTATAFVGAEVLRKEFNGSSPWYGVAGYTVAAATGYLRMYNRKHWCSDVLAGAGIGIVSAQLAYIIYPVTKRIFSKKNKKDEMIILPFYKNGAAGMCMVLAMH
jgi:hypothetical protein